MPARDIQERKVGDDKLEANINNQKMRKELLAQLQAMRDRSLNFPEEHKHRFNPKNTHAYRKTLLAKSSAEYFEGTENNQESGLRFQLKKNEVKDAHAHAVTDAYLALNHALGAAYTGFTGGHPINDEALEKKFAKLEDALNKIQDDALPHQQEKIKQFVNNEKNKLEMLRGQLQKELQDLKASLDKQEGILFSTEHGKKASSAYAHAVALGNLYHTDLWIRDGVDPTQAEMDRFAAEDAQAGEVGIIARNAENMKRESDYYKTKIEALIGAKYGIFHRPGSPFEFRKDTSNGQVTFYLHDIAGSKDSWFERTFGDIGNPPNQNRMDRLKGADRHKAWNELMDLTIANSGSRSIGFAMPDNLDKRKIKNTYLSKFETFLSIAEERNSSPYNPARSQHVYFNPDNQTLQQILAAVSSEEGRKIMTRVHELNANYWKREAEMENKQPKILEHQADYEVKSADLDKHIKQLGNHEHKQYIGFVPTLSRLLEVKNREINFTADSDDMKTLDHHLDVLDERLANAVRVVDELKSLQRTGADLINLKEKYETDLDDYLDAKAEAELNGTSLPREPMKPPELQILDKIGNLHRAAIDEVKGIAELKSQITGDLTSEVTDEKKYSGLKTTFDNEIQKFKPFINGAEGKPSVAPLPALDSPALSQLPPQALAELKKYRGLLEKAATNYRVGVGPIPAEHVPAPPTFQPLSDIQKRLTTIGDNANKITEYLKFEHSQREHSVDPTVSAPTRPR